MAQRLNRIASGLLSLFQIKSLGRNPQELSDIVQGTLELSNFYFSNIGVTLEVANTTGVGLTERASAQSIITIPDGEIWAVRMVATDITVSTFAASEAVLANPAIDRINNSADQLILNDGMPQTTNAGFQMNALNSQHRVARFDNPLFLPGGVRIYSYISQVIGTTVRATVDTRVLYYKLEK